MIRFERKSIISVSSSMSIQSNNKYKGFERAFCIRMKSTLTKRGCQFKQSTGHRVSESDLILIFHCSETTSPSLQFLSVCLLTPWTSPLRMASFLNSFFKQRVRNKRLKNIHQMLMLSLGRFSEQA